MATEERPLDNFTSEERSKNPHHHTDPGFINRRLCLSTFGSGFANRYEQVRVPGDDHWTRLRNDHRFVDLSLRYCGVSGVKTLGEALLDPQVGEIFSSTEALEGTHDVYDKERVQNRVLLPFEYERDV